MRHFLHNYTWVQTPSKKFSNLHEGFLKNGTFSILLCNKIIFDPNLALFPPLSAAPHSPRGIQNTPKNVLRGMRSGLTKVEKLQFWQGFEPKLILKNQKLSKMIFADYRIRSRYLWHAKRRPFLWAMPLFFKCDI